MRLHYACNGRVAPIEGVVSVWDKELNVVVVIWVCAVLTLENSTQKTSVILTWFQSKFSFFNITEYVSCPITWTIPLSGGQ